MKLAPQIVPANVEVGDLIGEILGLDRDGRQEIGQWAILGDLKPLFHLLCGLAAEQCLATLAADDAEALLITGPLVD